MSKFTPHPVDTSGIVLGPELEALVEGLARNVHDNWAAQRLRDGWRLGTARDDVALEHPSLIPYEALSESEKDYDRRTVTETLKAVLALGWRLEKP